MPFNASLLASAANKSAEVWQRLACLPERINSDEMVDMVICFPLQQLGRWSLYVWTYFCVSPYPDRLHYASSDSDDDDDSDHAGGASSSTINNDYHQIHHCSYCTPNSVGYDSSSSSD